MSTPTRIPFRAGDVGVTPVIRAAGIDIPVSIERPAITPQVLVADVSEFQPWVVDAVYLEWSKAIVVRAMYGSAHDDQAWFGGWRRTFLHQGGVRFLGIYQYLVAGQSGADQARAFRRLVGPIQPGEVFIADVEEGDRAMLTAWYDEMLVQYGQDIHKYLWVYTGESFGAANDLLPVEWIAAYGQTEPASPHKLWQFTDSYQVPGVGTADCSVFHGTIDDLAALAYQDLGLKSVSWDQWPESVTLQLGSTGQAVKVLQTALSNSGLHGVRGIDVDGSFEQQTLTAVKNFQLYKFGLSGVDGIAGPKTRAALIALSDV